MAAVERVGEEHPDGIAVVEGDEQMVPLVRQESLRALVVEGRSADPAGELLDHSLVARLEPANRHHA